MGDGCMPMCGTHVVAELVLSIYPNYLFRSDNSTYCTIVIMHVLAHAGSVLVRSGPSSPPFVMSKLWGCVKWFSELPVAKSCVHFIQVSCVEMGMMQD